MRLYVPRWLRIVLLLASLAALAQEIVGISPEQIAKLGAQFGPVAKIFEIIREIAAQGVTILLVEQNARLALEAADRGYVMESGVIALADEARRLLADPKVREAYLGEGAA